MESQLDEERERREFVKRLRKVLDVKEMSQTELARRLGQAQSGVSDWFTKFALPSGETLVRMFQLREFRLFSADWLLTGQGQMVKDSDISVQEAYYQGGLEALANVGNEVERARALWTVKHKPSSLSDGGPRGAQSTSIRDSRVQGPLDATAASSRTGKRRRDR